jgi:hypothetical protein
VVHGDEGPVGYDAGDADAAVAVFAGDEVFDGGGIELGSVLLVWVRSGINDCG